MKNIRKLLLKHCEDQTQEITWDLNNELFHLFLYVALLKFPIIFITLLFLFLSFFSHLFYKSHFL